LAMLPAIGRQSGARLTFPAECTSPSFIRFLQQQRLHGIWAQALEGAQLSPDGVLMKAELINAAKLSAALELPQQQAMREAHDLLENSAVPYFFAKGTHLRSVFYAQPWHRPAHDIDIFVHHSDKDSAIRKFIEFGFKAKPMAKTITHELKLSRYNTDIDLHWHLMRPSRFRGGLEDWLFAHREKFGDYWGLDATASLLVMLVHPAITKYLISPTSMLIHQVDQILLIDSQKIDWEDLVRALIDSRLKTAAWSSVYLLEMLSETSVEPEFERLIRPGTLKRIYLKQWIDKAWISRFFDRRWQVATGFSLALQDTFFDTLRAALLTMSSRSPYGADPFKKVG